MKMTNFLQKLSKVTPNGNGWTARCPAHADRSPSLCVKEAGGKILVKCFSGCSAESICAAMDLEVKDLFTTANGFHSNNLQPNGNGQARRKIAAYDYTDENGNLLFQAVRYEPKDFRQRRPDGKGGWICNLKETRLVLYRLPEVIASPLVYIVEGEKDVETLRKNDLTASCSPMGAGKWRKEYSEFLRDKTVIILPDNDESGRKHALQVANSLYGIAKEIVIVELPNLQPKGDVTDYLNNGGTIDALIDLAGRADAWQPINTDGADGESISDFEETENTGAMKVGFTFGELQKIELPERVEIVRGLGRGEIGLLNAVSHTGKSTLIRNLALNLVLGKPFEPLTAGGQCYRVAIIDSEDTLTFLRSDLNKMQADFSDAEKKLIEENLFLICELSFGDEDLKLNKPEHFRRVVAAINDFGADFIFIDTVTSAFAIRNENDNSEIIESVMHPLKRLAKLTNAGVLTAHHIGKAKLENGETKEGIHRGRGASAFADKSRTIFNLDKDGDDRVILSCPKLKGEKFADTIFKYDKDRRLFERQGITSIVTNYEILLDAFENDKGYKRKDIDEILEGEMSKATITRNLKTAIERGDLTRLRGVYSKNAQMLTPYSDEHLSINGNGTAETKNNLPEKEMCPKCERELDRTPNGQMFCEICLYSK